MPPIAVSCLSGRRMCASGIRRAPESATSATSNDPKARRFRDLVNIFVEQLGGLERVSEIRLGMIRQLAVITVKSEEIAARMVMDQEVDVPTMCMLASTILRLSSRLGLERIEPPKPGMHDAGGLLDVLRRERADTSPSDEYHDGDDAA
jgi:hypothetical protein